MNPPSEDWRELDENCHRLQHVETERKFLVTSDAWRDQAVSSAAIEQFYLGVTDPVVVRVRTYGDEAFLAVKSRRRGLSRVEIESPVSPTFVAAIRDTGLHLASPVRKTRHRVPVGAFVFEVDEYAGHNAGLVVAEIEIPSADTGFSHPEWLGEEVSDQPRYGNFALALRPYDSWE